LSFLTPRGNKVLFVVVVVVVVVVIIVVDWPD